MTNNSILVLFDWLSVEPDNRRFKPSSPVLQPENLRVGVEIPMDAELLYNYNEIENNLKGEGTLDYIILTPKGMRFVIDTLENVMSPSTNEQSVVEDDWDEPENKPVKKYDDSDWEDNDKDWND